MLLTLCSLIWITDYSVECLIIRGPLRLGILFLLVLASIMLNWSKLKFRLLFRNILVVMVSNIF
jgi:hypothetical protein